MKKTFYIFPDADLSLSPDEVSFKVCHIDYIGIKNAIENNDEKALFRHFRFLCDIVEDESAIPESIPTELTDLVSKLEDIFVSNEKRE